MDVEASSSSNLECSGRRTLRISVNVCLSIEVLLLCISMSTFVCMFCRKQTSIQILIIFIKWEVQKLLISIQARFLYLCVTPLFHGTASVQLPYQ